ncbi:MAG TPA: rhomboid family intramembrane serine protease [Longimicrobiales bacterium]|nr:rhomboid family intramembrane serine protease [Longimicrobiales bacterium]
MTPWVLRLIIANVAVYILTAASPLLMQFLGFVPAWALYRPWTPITYMFVHAGIWHIGFNMLALFFFGPRVEARMGGRRFLVLYFLSGLGGAALSFITPYTMVVGASGAIFGVLLAFARYWPHERIYIWGVLPVPAAAMVVGLVVISLYLGIRGGGTVAHFAHLGGFGAGWLYLKWLESRRGHFKRKATPRAPSTLDRVSGKARREEASWRAIDLDSLHEVNREEVDRILRKIDDDGADSLTPDERAFMNRMVG